MISRSERDEKLFGSLGLPSWRGHSQGKQEGLGRWTAAALHVPVRSLDPVPWAVTPPPHLGSPVLRLQKWLAAAPEIGVAFVSR